MCGSRYNAYCCPGWKTLPGGNQCIVRKLIQLCVMAEVYLCQAIFNCVQEPKCVSVWFQ